VQGFIKTIIQRFLNNFSEFWQYVDLKNRLAVLNGYEDYGDQLRMKYESETFQADVEALYRELEPLYKELHAYIRRKLYNVYGEEVVDLKGKWK